MKLKLLVLALLVSGLGWSQLVIPDATPVTQNFNGMGNSATATLPSGFRVNQANDYIAGVTATTQRIGTTGAAPTTGGVYNFANGDVLASTDRALGFLNSTGFTSPRSILLEIQNTGSQSIVSLNIQFDYEKYRSGTRAFNWTFFHGYTASPDVSNTGGDQSYVGDANNTTVFNPPTSIAKTVTITDININPGDFYYLRWTLTGVGGSTNGQAIGIDNFSIAATFGIPSPPVINSDLNSSILQNTSYSYFITGTYNPNSFNATGLPPGLGINTSTGEISGTPTVAGTYDIIITASNPGGSDVETLQLVVFPPGPEINLRGATGGTQNIVSGSIVASGLNNTLFAGQAIGASQMKDFRIQNLGTANLILNGNTAPYVTIGGFHPGDFTITQPASGTITPGNFIDFQITFSPQGAGIRTAIISIANNDSDENPYTFLVQGNGLAPLISVSGNGLVIPNGSATPSEDNFTFFGGVNTVSSKSFYAINMGGENLTVTLPVTISGPNASDFSVTTNPTSTIAPNAASEMVITFTPSALGLRTALVSIDNNVIGSSPYTFAISGTGIDFDLCQYGATETIKNQDFEVTPSSTAWSYTHEQFLGAIPPQVTGGQARGSSRTIETNKFIGARSFQVAGPFGTSSVGPYLDLTFDTVDTSEYREVSLSFNLGSYSTNDQQGTDVSDIVTVMVSVDNGVTWSRELLVKGSNNAIWDINTATGSYVGVYKGAGVPYENQAGNNSVNSGSRVITLNNLPSVSQLKVKFEFLIDRLDEIWVIDNVTLSGKYPLRSVWNGVWTPSAPTSTRKAIFESSYDSEFDGGSITACSCEIQSGATVAIDENDTFDIGSEVVNNGMLEIKNSGSLVQRYDYASNIGTIKMTRTTRNMYRWDYVYWGSPVEENIIAQIPNPQFDKKYKWVPGVGANWFVLDAVTPGQGFITRVRNQFPFNDIAQVNRSISFDFTGKPNNGLVNATMTRVDADALNFSNYNLLANPYPSAIDAELFLTQNSGAIDGTIYYWTSITPYPGIGNYQTGDYAKWNLTGGVGTNAANDSPSNTALRPDGQIVAGQGFFVQALVNNATVTFRNAQRLITDNTQFFRMAQPQTTQSVSGSKHRFWLNLTSENGHFNQMLIGYLPGATNDIDWGYDGFSVVNNPVNIYSHVNGKSLSIQGRALPFDQNDIVPLGLRITTAGTYKIALDEVDGLFSDNQIIYLEDLSTGAVHNLKQSPYSFTSAAGTFESRFQIRYTNVTLGIDEVIVPSNTVWVYGTDVMTAVSSEELLANVVVHDLLGRRLYEAKNISAMQHVIGLKPAEQVLLVTITLANGQVETRKVKF